MGGSSYSPGGGQTLAGKTFGAYDQALKGAGQQMNTGGALMKQGTNAMGNAYNQMGISAGQYGGMADYGSGRGESLANSNLAPYMNPYQKNVIRGTMGELNRQETMQGNDIGSAAQAAGAYGGDRQAVQLAENNRNFDTQRYNALAGLNSSNFQNAQNMANTDISRNLGAQQFGIAGRAGMAGQMGQLGQSAAQMGQNASQYGQGQMGQLANMGFGMGQTLQNSQAQAGAAQQALQQQILNGIKGATQGYTGYGDTGLQRYFGSISSPGGYGQQNSQTNPGLLGMIGGIGSIIAPFMSDARLKKNIEPVGLMIITGDDGDKHSLNVYDYLYAWESEDDPKTRGVMAQELLPIKPSAVVTLPNGYMAVHYSML